MLPLNRLAGMLALLVLGYHAEAAEDLCQTPRAVRTRVSVLGPLIAGEAVAALDPPTDEQIMRTWERERPLRAGLIGETIERVKPTIIKEKIADYSDSPRSLPLIGPTVLHHAHYKCTIRYAEVMRFDWPLHVTLRYEDAREAIYVDHNHFHMLGNADRGKTTSF